MILKLSVIVLSVVVVAGLIEWRMDIANDQAKRVKIIEPVAAYNRWECGYSNHPDCQVVFEVKPGAEYQVRRIRYGKDFMAMKIKQGDADGWIFNGAKVQFIARSEVTIDAK